jgi:hypothetical protein
MGSMKAAGGTADFIHPELHRALESLRSGDDDSYPSPEWIGGDPRFVGVVDVFPATAVTMRSRRVARIPLVSKMGRAR